MTPSTYTRSDAARRADARSGVRALLAVALVTLSACGDTVDRLLTATTPSRLAEETFLVPQNAPLIVASAQADFECALGGYVVASGLAAGELADVSQTAARWSYDRRNVLPLDATYATASCVGLGVYTPISTARYTADQALARLDGWSDAEVPNRALLIARAAFYAGYSYVLLAEGFCEATVNLGARMTTAQLLDSAESRFSRAITLAGTDSTLLRAASVGRARARLGKGNAAGAASDAANVPTSFVLLTTADNNAARRQNRVFAENNNTTNGVTVAEAYRNLTVAGAQDPRVRVTDQNRLGGDQVNRIFTQTKYASLTAGIPIASGVEARLIEAEARGAAQGVGILNTLRARAGVGLPALTAAEAASFTATIYSERARELFLQGNRWFDVRRGNLPLAPTVGLTYAKGGVYGDQRCWPLPDVERAANPNLGG